MAAADSSDNAVAASTCAHCQREIPSSNIALHSAHCARNLQKCEHCGDMVPRKLMDEHYEENHAPDVCGNRTEYCQTCRKYIRLREWIGHELQFHTGSNAGAGLSSDGAPAAAGQPVPRPARPAAAHGSQRKQILLTIAVAGFAVLIGSILYQRKGQ
nr:unnamed protein product [Digitaria exilis]